MILEEHLLIVADGRMSVAAGSRRYWALGIRRRFCSCSGRARSDRRVAAGLVAAPSGDFGETAPYRC